MLPRLLLTLLSLAALWVCVGWLLDPAQGKTWQAIFGIVGWLLALRSIWRRREPSVSGGQ